MLVVCVFILFFILSFFLIKLHAFENILTPRWDFTFLSLARHFSRFQYISFSLIYSPLPPLHMQKPKSYSKSSTISKFFRLLMLIISWLEYNACKCIEILYPWTDLNSIAWSKSSPIVESFQTVGKELEYKLFCKSFQILPSNDRTISILLLLSKVWKKLSTDQSSGTWRGTT